MGEKWVPKMEPWYMEPMTKTGVFFWWLNFDPHPNKVCVWVSWRNTISTDRFKATPSSPNQAPKTEKPGSPCQKPPPQKKKKQHISGQISQGHCKDDKPQEFQPRAASFSLPIEDAGGKAEPGEAFKRETGPDWIRNPSQWLCLWFLCVVSFEPSTWSTPCF